MRTRVLLGILILALGAQSASAAKQKKAELRASAAQPAASAAPDVTANARPSKSFVIGVEDVLSISVWKEPELSRTVPVRPDGKVSLPLVGEVVAAGLTPLQLEADLGKKLSAYITTPSVTVIVAEIRSQKINIVGEVAHPGSYALSGPTRVLDVIATAGGFRDFAKTEHIYVLRTNDDGTTNRIAFNYKDVVKGRHAEQNVLLQARDTVVVP